MDPVSTYEAFKYQWKIWRYTGIDSPSVSSAVPKEKNTSIDDNSKRRAYYLLYAIVINIFITTMFPATLVINTVTSSNLEDFFDSLPVTITVVMCILKLLNIVLQKRKLRRVKDIVEKLDKRAADTDEKDILQKAVKFSHHFYFILHTLYWLTAFATLSILFFSTEQDLMFPAWIPLNWKNSRRDYILANGYQLLAIIIQGAQNVACDTYPQAYFTILCSHMETLSVRIGKIAKDHRKSLTDNYTDLTGCIKDYQDILQLYHIIQDVLSHSCWAQFFCSGFTQCTIALFCLYMEFNITRLVSMALLFLAITLQIYILCHFGHNLMSASEELSNAIYSCNWFDQSERFKTALIVLLRQSQESIVIMAGGLIPVILPTFLMVVKSAYSLFAVLNELQSTH